MARQLHGYKPAAPGRHGEFHFATIRLFKALELAQCFPGRNKHPSLRPWSKRESTHFEVAFGKVQDTFWKLDRSAELFDEARRKFVGMKPPSTTIENIISNQQATLDIPLFLDTILSYAKIFVDSLAGLTSHCYPGEQVGSRSFRDQMDWFLKKKPEVDPAFGDVLRANTGWFVSLAGDSAHHGLRDLVVHQTFRTQLFYQFGKTPGQNQVHAFLYSPVGSTGSLLPLLQQLWKEFFVYLDLYVEHFTLRLQQQVGRPLVDWSAASASVLFTSETELPSSWLYPRI